MPEVGEIVSDKKPGQRAHKFIWAKCPDCGVERWQQYKPSKPGSIRRCKECHTEYVRHRFKLH
jgi:ribosomal protein S27E